MIIVSGAPVPRHQEMVFQGGKWPSLVLTTPSKQYQRRVAVASCIETPRQLGAGGEPIEVVARFFFDAGRRHQAGSWHAIAPDIDKCLRNLLDGLQRGPTGKPRPKRRPRSFAGKPMPWPGVIHDDARVARCVIEAMWADVARTEIEIREMD